MNNNIPSESDWRSEPWGIDTPYAYNHFQGKSREDAVEFFVENAIYYQEDIMFMPEACFRYYIHSYMDYLFSGRSAGDSDAANCFFGIVEIRKDDIARADFDLRQRILDMLKRLASQQAWYEADIEIYGDFIERSAQCMQMIDERLNK